MNNNKSLLYTVHQVSPLGVFGKQVDYSMSHLCFCLLRLNKSHNMRRKMYKEFESLPVKIEHFCHHLVMLFIILYYNIEINLMTLAFDIYKGKTYVKIMIKSYLISNAHYCFLHDFKRS